MDLAQKAYSVDYRGKSDLVIKDHDLLTWAAEKRKSPVEAVTSALGQGIIPLRYLKNFQALSLEEQRRICAAKVLICGCGGLGGISANLLARVGVGCLRLIDRDNFVISNLNRQWACDTKQLSRPKALVAAEQIRVINPLIDLDVYQEALKEDNVGQLVQGTDLVLDALDNLETRFILGKEASRQGISFIHAAVAGWWGQISTFLPGSDVNLEKIYGKKRSRDTSEETVGVLGPTAAVIGSLQAMEAVRVLTGRPPAYKDRLFYFEGESAQSDFIPL